MGSSVGRRNLPADLLNWVTRPGSAIATVQLTADVELVAVTGDAGTVKAVTLIGTALGQCESYDTLLAWALLLEALQPDWVDLIDAGWFDQALIERHGLLRGIVHLS